MANYPLTGRTHVRIIATDDAGNPQPLPSDDGFTVVSSDPLVSVEIGTMSDGGAAVVFTPQPGAGAIGVAVDLTDSAGLKGVRATVDVPATQPDGGATALGLDFNRAEVDLSSASRFRSGVC